ncbi:hypothetical protein WJX74_005926 [Apatococcus lobatus]|uniref:Uncharacterized protein n=1 Tax=Apatococcus lobatus TaxID=904363 RepID=A0AAW1QBA1_9CHLO
MAESEEGHTVEPTSTSAPAEAAPEAAEAQAPDAAASETRNSGSCKWFNASKGYGFIEPEGGGEDLFVHQSNLEMEGFRSLREGESVQFVTEIAPDGRQKAIKVTGPGGAAPQGAPRRLPQPPIARPPLYDMTGRGMGGRRGRGRGGRGGPQRIADRRPPPGTPGISSGERVVVHNLPWICTWQLLKDHFAGAPGLERADVIIDDTGRSRGFGIVKFSSPPDAVAAVQHFHNSQIGGRPVSVRIDRFA